MASRGRSILQLVAVLALTTAFATACATPGADEPVPSATTQTAEPMPDPTVSADAGGDVDAVGVGMPYAEALAAIGATEVADSCAWVGTVTRDGVMVVVQRDEAGDDASPVVLVSISAAEDGVGAVGPRTPEGIGVGSTVDEARAAYPDAQELAPEGMGDRRYLRVDVDADADLFFSYTEGEELVWAMTTTTLDLPPYEPCA